jgi:hypothetical protein
VGYVATELRPAAEAEEQQIADPLADDKAYERVNTRIE